MTEQKLEADVGCRKGGLAGPGDGRKRSWVRLSGIDTWPFRSMVGSMED
jgi:hypothetical protein